MHATHGVVRVTKHLPKNNNVPSLEPLCGIPHTHGHDVSREPSIGIRVQEGIHTAPRNPHELEDMYMEAP